MTEPTPLLRDLVSIPSVNPMGRNLSGPELYEHRVTAYLEGFFKSLGVPFERQPVAPLRENILARYERPGARRTIIFEAHQDTVPTDKMTIDPFGAKIENGKLYGRGACDIKGGMSSMLAAFARIVKDKPKNGCNVIMACSVDEEHTIHGIQRMAKGLKADMCIVAEPTKLQIVNAHKGIVRWFLDTAGRSCHSSSPEQGINAFYRMARVLTALEKFADKLRSSKTDELLGPPTLSVGRIEGGTSVNTVPDYCRIEIDRRLIRGEDPMAAPGHVMDYLRKEAGLDFPINNSAPYLNMPALGPEKSGDLVKRLGQAINGVIGNSKVISVPYGTDASTIAEAGIPTVVFGPGDIAQAHTCDEWIDLEQLNLATEILYKLAAEE